MTTDIRSQSVIELVRAAMASDVPARRAQMLAEAQRQIGWALRSAVMECHEADVTWRGLAGVLGLAHDRLFRQYSAGGPIVVDAPFYKAGTRNDRSAPLLVVGFRTVDDGQLHGGGEDAVRDLDSFEMRFNPAGQSPYRDRDLKFYYKPVAGVSVADLGRSAGYTVRPVGLGIALHLAELVFDELYGPPILNSPERMRWEAAVRASGDAPP